MNDEKDDAAFYEAHKSDPAVWGEPVEEPEPLRRGGMGATITVRFPADEAEAIRHRAKEAGLTYSEVVRHAVSAYLRPRFTLEQGHANIAYSYPTTAAQSQWSGVRVTRSAGDTPASSTNPRDLRAPD